MIEKIVSGGFTGVEQAALTAACIAGVETGGVAPSHYKIDNGEEPTLIRFGIMPFGTVRESIERNVVESDATLVIVRRNVLRAAPAQVQLATLHGKPHCTVYEGEWDHDSAALWTLASGYKKLYVSGDSHRVSYGIGFYALEYTLRMIDFLRRFA